MQTLSIYAPRMSKVVDFPGYNSEPGVLAVPAQLTERIRAAKRQGREVHVSAVIVEKLPSGFWAYYAYFDSQPREVLAWSAYELDRHSKLYEGNETPTPDQE